MTQTTRPGGAPDRRPPGGLPLPRRRPGLITHGYLSQNPGSPGLYPRLLTDWIFRTQPSTPLTNRRPLAGPSRRRRPWMTRSLTGRRYSAASSPAAA
jgi:hypothetical protein